MSAAITVAEVKLPGPGKKFGSVYDTTGQRWGCPPEFLNSFVPGGSYNINYEDKVFNGSAYKQIKSVINGTVGGNAPQPRSVSATSTATAVASDRLRRLDIFICGALNNMLANPQVNPLTISAEELVAWVNVMKGVWSKSLYDPFNPARQSAQTAAAPTAPGPSIAAGRGDMNDEIPF